MDVKDVIKLNTTNNMNTITSERAIGAFIKRFCSLRGFKFIKLNPASYVGIPDRIILTTKGNVVWMELKSLGESLRPMQEHWAKWLEENMHLYLLIDHVDNDVVINLHKYFDMIEEKRAFNNTFDREYVEQIMQQIQKINKLQT